MRAVQVPAPGEGYEVVERPVPDPGPEEVRVRVEACGVCGGDEVAREGAPVIEYPRIPGHEVVGVVDAVGEGVTGWSEGDRVGFGWHGGHCFACESCRRGNFRLCAEGPVSGAHRDGGFAEYALARREALAAVPGDLAAAEAAPLLCAGLTTFNALRNAEARPGDLVAVVGIGGLGHLGVQYAHRFGFETVAVSRGTGKRSAARSMGADHFVDSESEDPAEALGELGGARTVLSTAPASDAVAGVVGGLGDDGEVIVVGAPDDPVPVDASHLVGTRGSVSGWSSGSPADAEDALSVSARLGVTPEVERFDLADAERAHRRVASGEVRFRAVLEP